MTSRKITFHVLKFYKLVSGKATRPLKNDIKAKKIKIEINQKKTVNWILTY